MSAGLAAVAAACGLPAGLLAARAAARLLVAEPEPVPVPGPVDAREHALGGRRPGVDRVAPLATAALFGLLAWRLGPTPLLPAFLVLAAVLVALTLVDVRVLRLPDALTLPSYPVGAVLLGAGAWLAGDPAALWGALAGAVGTAAGFLLLAVVHPAGMGLGDVKLAGLLGMHLGVLGLRPVLTAVVLAFVSAAVFALVAVRGRRTAFPMGPFLAAGALAAVLLAGAPS